ncbi:hypothetical protein [Streptomyces sp. NPDC001068]|uniref:hypothetical protein n=1 Tax=Streptomyces sp. NPDC001068 TaxID=3364544 RepID=UPI0036CCD246
MKYLKALKVTLPVMLATLMLSIAGSMSTASAATTYWTYEDRFEDNCLAASPITSNVWSDDCSSTVIHVYDWYWGNGFQTVDGVTYRALISRANDKCLTTDNKTSNNALWTSTCDGGDQWWNGDFNNLRNLNGNYLRTSGNGNAVYASPYYVGVEFDRFYWEGYRHS